MHMELWCRLSESNQRPTDYKSVALPTELSRHGAQGAALKRKALPQGLLRQRGIGKHEMLCGMMAYGCSGFSQLRKFCGLPK